MSHRTAGSNLEECLPRARRGDAMKDEGAAKNHDDEEEEAEAADALIDDIECATMAPSSNNRENFEDRLNRLCRFVLAQQPEYLLTRKELLINEIEKLYALYSSSNSQKIEIQFILLIGKLFQVIPFAFLESDPRTKLYMDCMINMGKRQSQEMLETTAYIFSQFSRDLYEKMSPMSQFQELYTHLVQNVLKTPRFTFHISQMFLKLTSNHQSSDLCIKNDILHTINLIVSSDFAKEASSVTIELYIQPMLMNVLDSLANLSHQYFEEVKIFCANSGIICSIFDLMLAKNDLNLRLKSINLLLIFHEKQMFNLEADEAVQKLWFIIQNLLISDIPISFKNELCKFLLRFTSASIKYQNIIIISNDFLAYASKYIIDFAEKFQSYIPDIDDAKYICSLIMILATLTEKSEANRNSIYSQYGLLSSLFLIIGSSHFIAPRTTNNNEFDSRFYHTQIIAESSLNFILSFSRSVKCLRTILLDIGAARYIKNYLTSSNPELLKLALKVSGNFSMVFSPFRENFTDSATLKNIVNNISPNAIDEKSVIAVNVLSNLAYWSSRGFAELLINSFGSKNIINSSKICLDYLKRMNYNCSNQMNFFDDNNYLYLSNSIDFLRNTTFERFENDDLVLRYKNLFIAIISDFFTAEIDSNFGDELSKNILLLALNCCNSKKCKSIFILHDPIISKICEILKASSSLDSQMIVLAILREIIGFGSFGYKERISTLKSRNLIEILKQQLHNPNPKEKKNNKQFVESIKCLLEILV